MKRRPVAATAAATPARNGRAPPTGWVRVPANAGHGLDGRFAPGTNRHVTDCVSRRDLRNSNGIVMKRRRITDVGKAIGNILRHNGSLQVNYLGFAWLTDVRDDEGWRPTEPGILMAVAKDEKCRSRAEYLDGVHYSGDRKWIIRAIQGHSISIGRQLRDVDAYGTVDQWSGANMAVHGIRFDLLPAIVGWGPQDSCQEG